MKNNYFSEAVEIPPANDKHTGAAAAPKRAMKTAPSALTFLESGKFLFRTIDEAERLACFLAGGFPDPDRVVTGLAELLFNAVEHGNLGIGFTRKGELLQNNGWRQEIERLLNAKPFVSRVAEIVLTRRDGGIYVVVTDQGAGFNWRNFLRLEPDASSAMHGRGIAHARTVSFDRLTYNSRGNRAIAFVRDDSTLDW